MSEKKRVGNAKAFVPGNPPRYVLLGPVVQDEEGRLAIKLESLPISGSWDGWVNLFMDEGKES